MTYEDFDFEPFSLMFHTVNLIENNIEVKELNLSMRDIEELIKNLEKSKRDVAILFNYIVFEKLKESGLDIEKINKKTIEKINNVKNIKDLKDLKGVGVQISGDSFDGDTFFELIEELLKSPMDLKKIERLKEDLDKPKRSSIEIDSTKEWLKLSFKYSIDKENLKRIKKDFNKTYKHFMQEIYIVKGKTKKYSVIYKKEKLFILDTHGNYV